jgi:hypothetical protein
VQPSLRSLVREQSTRHEPAAVLLMLDVLIARVVQRRPTVRIAVVEPLRLARRVPKHLSAATFRADAAITSVAGRRVQEVAARPSNMKKNVNGQSGVEEIAVLPQSIANCLKDIEKGRAAIIALQDALACHIYDLPCKKKGRQHEIHEGLGDVDRAVIDETIANLASLRHSIRVTEDRLYSFGECRSPSSPAERGRKRFADWSQNFRPAAQAAMQMADEVEEAGYGDEQAEQNWFVILKPEDLRAVDEATIDVVAANLGDLADHVNDALAVITNLLQERR